LWIKPILRGAPGTDPLLFVFNFGDRDLDGFRLGVPAGGFWTERLNSEGEAYGGRNLGNLGGRTAEAATEGSQPYARHSSSRRVPHWCWHRWRPCWERRDTMIERRFFSDVTRYFDAAATHMSYPAGLLDQIKRCNSLYRFDFPVRQSDGSPEVVPAERPVDRETRCASRWS
jgi:hypothetical protein